MKLERPVKADILAGIVQILFTSKWAENEVLRGSWRCISKFEVFVEYGRLVTNPVSAVSAKSVTTYEHYIIEPR
jgi:hypothetical protein